MRRLKVTKWTSGLKTGSGGGVIKEETDAAAGRQRRAGGEDLTDEFVRESSQEV